ncbi:MAG: rhodanese-like domain-containing protein [Candidatus Baltobacteraceae bacterium]
MSRSPHGGSHVSARRRVVLYCGSGNSCSRAAQTLREKGLTNVQALAGGYAAWNEPLFPSSRYRLCKRWIRGRDTDFVRSASACNARDAGTGAGRNGPECSAADAVQAPFFSQAPARAQIAAAQTLLRRAGSRYGTGYVYRFTCERGAAIETFAIKDGEITTIAFSRG